MKIIFDNIIFSLQESGGISVVWYELLKRALADKSLSLNFAEEVNNNIFRQKLAIPEGLILRNLLSGYPGRFRRYLNLSLAKKKGIFHSSYYRIAKGPGIANITTVHDFTYEYYRKGLPKSVHRWQKGNAINHSKIIICVSQNTRNDLMKFYPEISPDRVKIIYNGVDDAYRPLQDPGPSKLRELIDFTSGEFVLFIGDRRSKYKNFEAAVKACRIASTPFVIVGGSPLTVNEDKYLSDALGHAMFKQTSGITNEQLNILYNHALCLLYPSLYEGFGIPVIEAQRAGCPVITTNYSSLPEVAGKGAAYLNEVTEFQIADMLQQFMNNLQLVSSLREEGFRNSLRFSWDSCYQQTKQVYKEVYEEF